MRQLARWASRYSSPYPMTHRFWGIRPDVLAFTALAVMIISAIFVVSAFAADATAAVPASDFASQVASLYGPICGVVAAVIILFERIARVIPNSTTSGILKVLLAAATILGVKVPDNQ